MTDGTRCDFVFKEGGMQEADVVMRACPNPAVIVIRVTTNAGSDVEEHRRCGHHQHAFNPSLDRKFTPPLYQVERHLIPGASL